MTRQSSTPEWATVRTALQAFIPMTFGTLTLRGGVTSTDGPLVAEPDPTAWSANQVAKRTRKSATTIHSQMRRRLFGGLGSETSPRSPAQFAAKRRGSLSPRISVAETPSACASARSESSSVAISSARRSGTPSRFHSCRHYST